MAKAFPVDYQNLSFSMMNSMNHRMDLVCVDVLMMMSMMLLHQLNIVPLSIRSPSYTKRMYFEMWAYVKAIHFVMVSMYCSPWKVLAVQEIDEN